MRRPALAILLLLIPLAFLAGRWFSGDPKTADVAERRILYYVDPMNPALRSTEPGIAPCGMPLEPVYADGYGTGGTLPAGVIRLRGDQRQLIGIEVESIERGPIRHLVRLTGRVVPDETRVHVVDTDVSGWVREVGPVTTGSFVRKGDVLGEFYSEELIAAQQNVVNALRTMDGLEGKDDAESRKQYLIQEQILRASRRSLITKGISEAQLEKVERDRAVSTGIEVRSPVTGQVLQRDFALGQRFGSMTALFVIADVERVWVLADALEADASSFPAGAEVAVRVPGSDRSHAARVGHGPAQFDAATRTSKVRLEVNNPRHELVPGMFVDVEREVVVSDVLSVPVSAVLDSGLRQRVFVDLGDGLFQPREVATGARFGDRVVISSGLAPGERVVVAGNFLLDSESRMRTAPLPAPDAHVERVAAP